MNRKQQMINLRNKRYTYKAIGDIFGITRQRVEQILNPAKYLYKLKPETEIPKGWIPGVVIDGDNGFQGTDFLAEKVRIRDSHTCQICSKVWSDGMRRFDVHHLDPECESVKTYENYKKFDRMITLCHKCHLRLPHIKIKLGRSVHKTPFTHIL